MNFRNFIFATSVALLAQFSWAHGGHGVMPMSMLTSEQAQDQAQKILQVLVEKKVIEPSWKEVKQVESTQQFIAGEEALWRVRFKNDAVADPDKQAVYIFVSGIGEYRGANHSGKY